MNDLHDDSPRAGGLARGALALAALWIAAGALFKLLAGSPNDLPPIVRQTLDLDLGLKYRLAIGIELAIAAAALLRPGLGWWMVGLLLVAFDVVLAFSLDQESCGCFGSSVPISPGQMMAIDTALLVAVLAGRPWRGFGRPRAPLPFLAGAMALMLALPWLLDRQVADGPRLRPGDGDGTASVAQGTDGTEETPQGRLGRDWVDFSVERWKGQVLHETPLADYTNVDELPPTGTYVLWRWTCDHCAAHLAHLAETDTGQRMIALIRLEEPNDTEANRAVFQQPSGPHVVEVKLPPTIDYVVTTPAELEVEDYVVQHGEQGVEAEGDGGHEGHDH